MDPGLLQKDTIICRGQWIDDFDYWIDDFEYLVGIL